MIRIGIVGHTARSAEAKRLARQVRADFVSIDNGVLGCDGNHEAVQRHLSALPGEWSVVLEDDAVIDPATFRQQLGAALAVAPTPIASFYLGKSRPPQYQGRIKAVLPIAQATGAHWLTSSHMLHAVAYAIRTDLLGSLLEFDSDFPADQHIGLWAKTSGHRVGYTLPSLCDHADTPTITEHPDGHPRRPGRVAWRVGTRETWSATTAVLTN